MAVFETERLRVEADEQTGFLRSIVGKDDPSGAEWVLKDSDWGRCENFNVNGAEFSGELLTVHAHHASSLLTMKIEKRVANGRFCEAYTVTNEGDCDFFGGPDTFGILFPFNTIVRPGVENGHMDEVCNAHVWCGGDTAWIYGHKLSGHGPFLVVYLTEGAMSEYSIRLQALKSRNDGFYRGDIQMDPQPFVLAPGETRTYRFEYELTDRHPYEFLTKETDTLVVKADRYTLFPGEKTEISVVCRRGTENVTVTAGETSLPVFYEKDRAYASFTAEKLGEVRVRVTAGGKTTWALLNVIEPVPVILQKRARFVAKHQQYHRPGRPYDGAYLAYDDALKTMVCEPWGDRNCGHERIAMGVIVAQALQRQPDEKLQSSFDQYLAFVRRELFDEKTYTVFTEAGRKNTERRRFYNDPWVAVLFREAYRLNGDKTLLHDAFGIMEQYFRLFGRTHDGTVVEVYELCSLLEEADMNEESEILKEHLKANLERFSGNGMKNDEFAEVGFCHEHADNRAKLFFDAYVHTNDPAYLERGEYYYTCAESFFSFQPDYHLFGISLRWWDAFWFGKKHQFGDTFPHYWSCDLAEAAASRFHALGGYEEDLVRAVLLGNLCLYRADGFAANTYLCPYHVRFARPADNPGVVPDGGYYGKTYDEMTNDQDWALYFAVKNLTFIED